MAISNDAQQDYVKSQWAPGMPITQARMDNLETGVYVNREAIQALDTDINGVNGLTSKITDVTSGIGSNEIPNYANKTLWQAISTLYSTIENATADSTAGANAWTQIVGLIGQDTLGNLKQSLSEYMAKYDQEDANIKMTLGVIIDSTGKEQYAYDNVNTVYRAIKALNDALGYDVSGNPVFGTRDGEGNLITVLNTMRTLTTNVNTVLTALNEAAPSPTYSSLANRLALMNTAIQNAADALSAANVSSVYTTETDGVMGPTTYGTLDERLEHIETEVVKNTNSVNSLNGNINDNYVRKADVRDNFTSTDTNLPLSAAKGKELRDMIGGTYSASNTVTSAISAAANTAETNAKNYADANKVDKTNIYNDLDYVPAQDATDDKILDARQGKALKDLIDGIDTAYKAADTALNGRLTAAESAITTLNGSGEGSVSNTVNTQIAAVVADAPEAFDTLKEIADWIDTHSDSAIEMQQSITDNADAIAALQDTITDENTGLAATKAIADAAAVKTEVDSALNGLDARLDAIDGGETLAGAKTLATRVSEAESAIITLQNEPKSATEIVAELPQAGDATKDYLVGPNEDGKYFYYKWINNTWNLISGGSGEGNTSGMDLTASEYDELESYNENTDYYVTRDDGIHHYRYIPNTTSGEGLMEVEIGIAENYNIGIDTVTETENNEEVDNTYLYLYKFAPDEDSEITDETALPLVGRGTLVRKVKLPATGGGIGAYEQIRIQPAAGQSTVFTTVEGNTTPIPLNLQGQKRDQDGYVATTLVITMQYRERGSDTWRTYAQGEKEISVTGEGAANFSTIDISPLLVLNKTIEIKVTAADKNDANLTNSSVTFSVTKVELNLTSTFNQSAPYTTSTVAFNYSYTGSGLNKTLYLYLNDTLLTTRTLGTGIGNGSYNIDMSEKTAGTYNLKAYFVTDDNNTSNTLNYSIMYIPADEALDHPIVGISIPETSITEGDILTINYSAYTQNADQTQEVLFELFEEGSSTAYASKKATDVNNNSPSSIFFVDYPIPADGVESILVTVRATASNNNQNPYSVEQVVTIMHYSDTSINFDPIETNLIYEFDPITHTNNDENRAEFTYSPHSGTTYTTTLEDFNWVSNGYLGDEALTFNGDAVMRINVPVLITNVAGTDINDTPTSHGRTIEFEYEVNSVTDINAPIITYFNNSNVVEGTDTSTKTGVGFEITPQNCYLISEAKSVVTDKKGFIHNEDDIAAAYLSEGSRLRVSFVIEAVGTHQTGAGNNAQTVNIYINGQYANSCPYDGASELFTVPADADCKITIGNDSSILKLYDVRIYNRGLTEAEILQNYVTSPLLRRDKLTRIRENDLLTANQQEIDYYKARQYYNCLLITGNLSPAKSEKVSCGLIFTQPNGEGGFDEKFRCMKTFPDGSYTSQNAVQGTSSVKFPVKNYKVYLTDGYELDEENKPKAVKYKYALEPGRVKESTFCWKGDYMSSDHANTFNANWADALETRIDGANHIQNSVYGFRCLLFYRPDAKETTPIVLIGDGTLNNDKGNTKTFQLEDSSDVKDSNDTRSQKWEFKNNTETPCLFQSDNLINIVDGEENYTAATEAFESTYPDEGDLKKVGVKPNYNHLQILLSWVLRRANYWDETDESARAAKKTIFKNEFTRHFNMDHMLLYYLFCEFTAMTDNRAKNMFIRCDNIRDEEIKNMSGTTLFSGNVMPDNTSDWYKYLTGTDAYKATHYTDIDWENSTFGVWTPILYDLDSCYGVENSGYLQVPYYANWDYRDVADTKYLFNGYGSILWLMFEDSFADEIRTMAQAIYANGANGEPGLNYNSFYKYHITDNALKFPPVIINQDMNKKYLNPWINGLPDPEDSTRMIYNAQYKYLQRGSRTDQKVGFIERRSRMLYSKYLTTQFIANEASVNFRCGNAGADDPIVLTAGTACYPAIQFSDTNSQTTTTAQQYANTGDSVSFTPGPGGMGFSDTVYIRGASMLTGITGIGGYMPYEINLSGGRNLKKLALGSSTIVNTQVSSSALSGLDACSILEDLNIENFNGSSFTTLNLASNRLLKNLYATGANNLGTCSFANGGIIENIELGTGLTNLTLRNQTRIETLKFGGSDTVVANNVSKINTIFVEGVSTAAMNVVQDIFKLRLYALKNQLDNGVAAGEAVALGGGVRISGLNMTITCRDSNNNYLEEADLLDLLINKEAMLGKGLTYDGKLSNTSYPYLSGTITINRGQDQKIAMLRSMYPNLTIVENNSVASHVITYKYDDYVDSDGNLITGTVIKELTVDKGTVIPDIYSTNLIEMPTRNSTVQYDFTFGERSYNIYIPSSGWRDQNSDPADYFTTMPLADSNKTILTHFHTEERSYPVRWLMNKDDTTSVVKTSISVPYGGGADLEAPTLLEIHEAGYITSDVSVNSNDIATYSIFSGWEKLPINIHPNANDTTYDIYAKWNTGSIALGSLFEDVTNLTPLQLAVLSKMSSTQRSTYVADKIDLAQMVEVEMGHDSEEDGIDLISDTVRFDLNISQQPIKTNIQPMTSENNAFTIMIDYSFNPSTTYSSTDNAAILMSCYYQNSSTNTVNGFALYNNLNSALGSRGPRVGFGDMFNNSSYSKPVGGLGTVNYEARNVIVLRHQHNDPVLYIYYGLNSSNHINSTVNVETITWNNSTSNAYINFGQLTDSTDTEYSTLKDVTKKAGCTIYKAKYWNKDLGLGECKRLAVWPHEKVTFGITNIANSASTGTPIDGNSTPSIGLSTLTVSSHGLLTEDTTAIGWGSSTYNTILNNKVILGLPTEMQAILGKPVVKYYTLVTTENNGVTTKSLSANVSNQRNYLYFPSVANIKSNLSTYPTEIVNSNHESGLFPWLNSGTITVYNYDTTASGYWNVVNESDPLHYMNLRFARIPLKESVRIFKETTQNFSSSGSTTIVAEIRRKVGSVNIGDIFIDISGNAYMYVSDEDILSYGAQVQPATGIFVTPNGGWIKSTGFWTRSMMTSDGFSYSNANHFAYCNQIGITYTNFSTNTTAPNIGLGLNYSLAI